jgi:2-polyprenyl-3-methyl-5-hydroxy-6-metoxy-1,4-benzoquinol methylase
MDMERAKEFGQELLRRYSDAMTVMFIDIGDRTGLLDATAQGGTAAEIADRAGLAVRPVREWLAGMTTAGVVDYDGEDDSFRLPAEHAGLLTGQTPYNLAPLARAAGSRLANTAQIAEAFVDGAGISQDEMGEDLVDVLDRMSRYRFDALLEDVYLPAAGDVFKRLQVEGGRVADLGCGSGHAANLIGRALPAAEVVGYDFYAPGLEQARAEAARMSLGNVRFEQADVGAVASDGPYDLITAFDVIHDLADPGGALAAVREALTDDGVFLMYDVGAPSDLDAQANLAWAPLMYGLSVGYCIQLSLAEDGTALGSMWGRERAEELLREAGFRTVAFKRVPLDPINLLYACHP